MAVIAELVQRPFGVELRTGRPYVTPAVYIKRRGTPRGPSHSSNKKERQGLQSRPMSHLERTVHPRFPQVALLPRMLPARLQFVRQVLALVAGNATGQVVQTAAMDAQPTIIG